MDLSFERLRQCDVLSRPQLREGGVDHDRIRTEVRARRWQTVGRAVVLHNGPLTRTQSLWCAVLDQPQPSALAGITAAIEHGLATRPRDDIHLVVPPRSRRRPRPGVVLHDAADSSPIPATGVARVSAARAIVQAAMWERSAQSAGGIFAAGFQQRVVRVADVEYELARLGGRPRVAMLTGLLDDIANGVGSMAEAAFLRLAGRAGLPVPVCQARRRDASGRVRYLDFDFGVFSVEVDGPLHWQVTADADNERHNALVRRRQRILRITTTAIRSDPDGVIRLLREAWRDLGPGD